MFKRFILSKISSYLQKLYEKGSKIKTRNEKINIYIIVKNE